MFRKEYPTFEREIVDPVDGLEYRFTLHIPSADQMERPAFHRPAAGQPWEVDGCIAGWNVRDTETGAPLPPTPDHIAEVLAHPPLLGAYLRAKHGLWEDAMSGKLVLGNSPPPPSGGPEATPGGPPGGGGRPSASPSAA